MALLGSTFKMLGKDFADALIQGTAHPVIGLFIGLLATSLIQSSSTTTSIVVGLVASGTLTIEVAVPIVMGANLGTTVTNTIVSLGHVTRPDEFRRAFGAAVVHDIFNICSILILFPLEIQFHFLQHAAEWTTEHIQSLGGGLHFVSPVKLITKPVAEAILNLFNSGLGFNPWLAAIMAVLISIVLIFFSLVGLTRTLKILMQNQVESTLDHYLSKSGYLSILIGCLLTVAVQSSSVTTAVLVPLVGAAVIRIEQAYPMTLGANIGTTVTAIIASTAGSITGLTIALVHLYFNLAGTAIFYPIPFTRRIPIGLARRLADFVTRNPYYAVGFILALFFIIPGTVIFIYEIFVHWL